MPGTVLGSGDLAVNEAKKDIPPSELTFYLVRDTAIKEKTNKHAIQCLVVKKNQVRNMARE